MHQQTIHYVDIYKAHMDGRALLANMPTLTPEILLDGITAIARRDWVNALTNLWITIEQLTSDHWKRWVAGEEDEELKARTKQFADTRTWTTALRQEMLLQARVIDKRTLAALFTARQARNALAHAGKAPDAHVLENALIALQGLMKPLAKDGAVKLFEIDLKRYEQQGYSARFAGPLEPAYWRHVPPLPRERATRARYEEGMKEIESGRRAPSPQQL